MCTLYFNHIPNNLDDVHLDHKYAEQLSIGTCLMFTNMLNNYVKAPVLQQPQLRISRAGDSPIVEEHCYKYVG